AILAHELAHIRRHDYLVNLMQTLVETVLFYHPAVWWLSRRIRIERENCCDDLAVSLCGDPVAYASALADLEALRSGPAPDHHIAMAATGGRLLLRVRRLLGAPSSHTGRGPAWLAGSVALLLIGGIALGADGLHRDRAATTAAIQVVPPMPPPPPAVPVPDVQPAPPAPAAEPAPAAPMPPPAPPAPPARSPLPPAPRPPRAPRGPRGRPPSRRLRSRRFPRSPRRPRPRHSSRPRSRRSLRPRRSRRPSPRMRPRRRLRSLPPRPYR